MKAALAMMFPVSLLGMRGQCYSVVTLVIIVRPAGAWSELTRARQPAGPRLLGFLPPWSASLARRGWTRVWGENFIKLYHLSCPWPALLCRLVCFRAFYGVINYRNTSAVPGYTVYCLCLRHFGSREGLNQRLWQVCFPLCHPWYATQVIHYWTWLFAVHS